MTMSNQQLAIQLFETNQGVLRLAQALRLGIPKHTIYQLTRQGVLERETRGLYRLANLLPPGNPDLVYVALRVPKAVFCLISALYFHNLTTQVPYRVYIALPQPVKRPRMTHPPLDVTWLSEKPYSSGIELNHLDGVAVAIYDREKTIADCFKFRKKVGLDVAIEALKEYLHQPAPRIDRLMAYARVDRVANLIRPYLESLI